MSENLLPFRAFAKRLWKSERTLDRWYARGSAGLPRVVRIGAHKYIAESEADRFIESIVKNGAPPGQGDAPPLQGIAAMRKANREKAKKPAAKPRARARA
jgi:hypothetical protein